ncbi:SPOR domain-containing protein [Thioalkalivibrio nitratireducens]|uniref:SPOR domain-containing protein n=1 Tax=Thioalkalivibrio nitratireducens TaxID=186931 RepID=UPI0005C14BE7|nr:SPOR domain-containing protein [Thioalkalivibrio nitratireducens]
MTTEAPVRYRMVGAVVLIFLAVLLLPWVFDGAGFEAMHDLERPIPERPAFVEPRLSPAAPRAAADGNAMRPPEDAIPAPKPLAPTPARPPSPPPAAAGTLPARPEAAARQPHAPAPVATDRERVGWAVQVGSFGRETNAREQAQRLREAGFTTFVERARPEGREVWRVKVGPLVQRDEALRLRDEIRSKVDVSGIVVAHP